VNLITLDQGRHWDHHGEFLGIALEVIDHCDHRFVVLTREHDLGRLVENLCVGFGDVKAAEALRGLGFKRQGEQQD
jgi:hypothetical protein